MNQCNVVMVSFDGGFVAFDGGSAFDGGAVAFDGGFVAFDDGFVAFDDGFVAFDDGFVSFDGGFVACRDVQLHVSTCKPRTPYATHNPAIRGFLFLTLPQAKP